MSEQCIERALGTRHLSRVVRHADRLASKCNGFWPARRGNAQEASSHGGIDGFASKLAPGSVM